MNCRRYIAVSAMIIGMQTLAAQNTLRIKVTSEDNDEPLIGVTVIVEGQKGKGVTTDVDGVAILRDLPDGNMNVTFSYVGYEKERMSFTLPKDTVGVNNVSLEPDDEELEEVIISSTRSTRTIQNIPTRVEFISSEELGEKSSMKPGDIRMLLNESTGIVTQQTSAISGNAAIRIQGLDGRYTQILKDGFPVFAGAASGLGLLQTPPLDLKQVEIIKGSSSTLYGGGAIAGLINLISKTPEEKRDLSLQLNGTTGRGLDVNTFYGQRWGQIGTTIFASYNHNGAYDPSDTGFTAIPKFNRFTFNPKLFLYFSDATQMSFGLNTMIEKRLGGDIDYVKGKDVYGHSYFERNKSGRYSSQLSLEHQFNEHSHINFKNSVTLYNRTLSVPDYVFDGRQTSTFSELSYNNSSEHMEWVGGANLWTDRFKEHGGMSRRENVTTYGAFAQNTWAVAQWFNLETGLRADYVQHYGAALLPRVSAHFKITDKFSSRLGGGLGYKAPTIFTEEAERIDFRGVQEVNDKQNKLERSLGANLDFNYSTGLFDDNVTMSINQLFFITRLNDPLLLKSVSADTYQMENIDGHTLSRGLETNVKLGYRDFHLFLGYTFTDAQTTQKGLSEEATMMPKHRFNSVLMYEVEDEWKIGLEAYYYSQQRLSDGLRGKPFWLCGFMVEKMWEHFSVYANFENFTDRRQTRFDSIYTGTRTTPEFRDIYAPLDGFVMNAGVKIRL